MAPLGRGADALAAHAQAELGIDPQQLARRGHGTAASFLSFAADAALSLLTVEAGVGLVIVEVVMATQRPRQRRQPCSD